MDDLQRRAGELVDAAHVKLSQGDIDGAAQRYRDAIVLFRPYASFELVIGDAYFEAERFADALVAYQTTVEAVHEHDQAWERLAECLHRLGRHDEGVRAMSRYQELRAGLGHGDASKQIEELRHTADINLRAKIVCDLAYSLDPAVPPILHAFVGEVAHDRKTGRHGSGNTFWAATASIMVRFGIADFLDWYSDGPAPSETWIMEDVEKYLKKNRHPPPLDQHQPIHFTKPR